MPGDSLDGFGESLARNGPLRRFSALTSQRRLLKPGYCSGLDLYWQLRFPRINRREAVKSLGRTAVLPKSASLRFLGFRWEVRLSLDPSCET